MCCQEIVESTDVQMHLSKKLRGITDRLIYGPRANKQFDIAF